MKSPRRNRMDKWYPAERAIWDAMQEIERMAADVRLTDAINKLKEAKELVGDFIDDIRKDK
jgi:UTP-glucose-1-phosphate uridylyltransferase